MHVTETEVSFSTKSSKIMKTEISTCDAVRLVRIDLTIYLNQTLQNVISKVDITFTCMLHSYN